MKERIETSVVIVGAGPVGLALAIDLAWRGIDCVVLEQGDGSVEHPRTGLVAVRTMEFFRRWGISSQVRQCGFPPDYDLSIEFCTSMRGHTLDRDEYPSMRDMETPSWTPEKKQRCPQQWLDPILKKALAAHPNAMLKFNCRVDGFEEAEGHVYIEARERISGLPVRLRCKYLVGCDGAGSGVRAQLGIEMKGKSHLNYSMGIFFRSPELLAQCRKRPAERFLFIGPEGTWGNLTVIDGRELWRLTVYGTAAKFDMENFDARLWIQRALGVADVGGAIPFEVLSVLPWKRTELIAERFGADRVLLAGDAAHTMSPTGGMGMNTGMGDAVDLGWKLEALLKGWGGPRLMGTYEIERKPIAARNAAYSTHNFKTWTSAPPCEYLLEDSAQAKLARERIGNRLKQATQSEWQSWGLQVGYRYEDSPICISDGTAPTPDDYAIYVPTARPGSRAPHAWLDSPSPSVPGVSTLDLFGRGFALLAFDGASEADVDCLKSAAARRSVPLTVTRVQNEVAAELYAAPLVMVRPDGHVAWRGCKVGDAERIVDVLRGAS